MSITDIEIKANQTKRQLASEFGDLRERLPIAFDNGLGRLSERSIAQLGDPSLRRQFNVICSCLSQRAKFGESSAALSIEEMTDEEVTALASVILSFVARLNASIEYQKKEVA